MLLILKFTNVYINVATIYRDITNMTYPGIVGDPVKDPALCLVSPNTVAPYPPAMGGAAKMVNKINKKNFLTIHEQARIKAYLQMER